MLYEQGGAQVKRKSPLLMANTEIKSTDDIKMKC